MEQTHAKKRSKLRESYLVGDVPKILKSKHKLINMKKLIKKTVELFTRGKFHSNFTAIKGNKSGGVADSSSYKHWQKNTSGDGPSVN